MIFRITAITSPVPSDHSPKEPSIVPERAEPYDQSEFGRVGIVRPITRWLYKSISAHV
jgi:hypothetical protein